jgi:hypothetical protein
MGAAGGQGGPAIADRRSGGRDRFGGTGVDLVATGPVLSTHAYRAAPPCVDQAVTADCRGVVAMTVNGVRTPAGAGWPPVPIWLVELA